MIELWVDGSINCESGRKVVASTALCGNTPGGKVYQVEVLQDTPSKTSSIALECLALESAIQYVLTYFPQEQEVTVYTELMNGVESVKYLSKVLKRHLETDEVLDVAKKHRITLQRMTDTNAAHPLAYSVVKVGGKVDKINRSILKRWGRGEVKVTKFTERKGKTYGNDASREVKPEGSGSFTDVFREYLQERPRYVSGKR